MSVAATRAVEGDSGSRAFNIRLSLSAADTQHLVFDLCLSGTATEGQSDDYYIRILNRMAPSDLGGGCTGVTASVPAGQTVYRSLVIVVNGDTDDEVHETVVLTLRSGSGSPADVAVSESAGRVVFTIVDDDVSRGAVPECSAPAQGCLGLEDWSWEGAGSGAPESSGGGFAFRVFQYPVHSTAWVHYRLCFTGSATFGVDYTVEKFYVGSRLEDGTAKCLDAAIRPGDEGATYKVWFTRDEVYEGDETVVVDLSLDPDQPAQAQGRRIWYEGGRAPSLTFVIIDDDAPSGRVGESEQPDPDPEPDPEPDPDPVVVGEGNRLPDGVQGSQQTTTTTTTTTTAPPTTTTTTTAPPTPTTVVPSPSRNAQPPPRSVQAPPPAKLAAPEVAAFSDLGDAHSPHRAALGSLTARGVFAGLGCAVGRLCPNDPITRREMAVALVRVVDGGDPAAAGSSRFSDVAAGVWWAAHVERLAGLGVTEGCATGPLRFCPDDAVTRAQTASFLKRAFSLAAAVPAGFADTAGNAHEADIDALHAAGITEGCAAAPLRFCPDDPVTRAQMASFLSRATTHAGRGM